MANIDLPFNARNGITTGPTQTQLVDNSGNITGTSLSTSGNLTVTGIATVSTINATTVSASNLTVVGTLTVPNLAGTPIFTGTGSGSTVTITDASNTSSGASIALRGNGSTTPNKYIRSFGGNLEIVNSGNTTVTLSLTDVGDLWANNSISSPGNVTSSGTGIARLQPTGDILVSRAGGSTGVIYFGSVNAGTRFLSYDGTNYNLPGTNLLVNGSPVLTSATAGLGYGQAWYELYGTGSRVFGVTYTNSTPRPIFVNVGVYTNAYIAAGPFTAYCVVDGVIVGYKYATNAGTNVTQYDTISFIVPPGSTYYAAGSATGYWTELR